MQKLYEQYVFLSNGKSWLIISFCIIVNNPANVSSVIV